MTLKRELRKALDELVLVKRVMAQEGSAMVTLLIQDPLRVKVLKLKAYGGFHIAINIDNFL